MSETQTQLPTDTWIPASWQEYLQTLTDLLNNKAKSYYYKGHMRLEMTPVSFDRGQDHVVINLCGNSICCTQSNSSHRLRHYYFP